MGQIVLVDLHTKIYGLFNDEIKDKKERFNEEPIKKMLEIIYNQERPDFQPIFYKRNDRDHGAESSKSWLRAIEKLRLEKPFPKIAPKLQKN